MKATAFDMDAPLDERRIIVRQGDEGVEMVELPWGLRPAGPGGRPFNLVRAEGRRFPTHRCLVPASEFQLTHRGRRLTFSLANGDWFYFAGIWRPASLATSSAPAQSWPEAYAILTIAANADVAPYGERQMAVLKRQQRFDWLHLSHPEEELLRPLPRRTFRVERAFATARDHGHARPQAQADRLAL